MSGCSRSTDSPRKEAAPTSASRSWWPRSWLEPSSKPKGVGQCCIGPGQASIRGLRPEKNSKGRCRLFISSFFVNVGVPRSNPLVEAGAVIRHIVSWGLRGPRRSPTRYAEKTRLILIWKNMKVSAVVAISSIVSKVNQSIQYFVIAKNAKQIPVQINGLDCGCQ